METAKKNIQSLMTPKAKILLHENNLFKVNKQLQSKLFRILFPVPLLEEVVKREKIAMDRSAAVDAAFHLGALPKGAEEKAPLRVPATIDGYTSSSRGNTTRASLFGGCKM